jgi:uncharacterized membrane protein
MRHGPTTTAPLLERVASWWWAIPVAVAPGWLAYALTRADPYLLIQENVGGSPGVAFGYMLAGVPLVVGLWAWIARLSRSRDAELQPRDAWLSAVLSTRVLLLGPLVLALAWDPEGYFSMRRPAMVLLGAGLVALCIRSWPAISERVVRILGGRWWPVVPLALGIGAAGFLLVRRAFWRHHLFETRAFDLAIYDNIAFNTSHGEFLRCTLIKGGVHTAAHFDPIMLPISWIYAIAPRAETLIVLQAIWVLAGVLPIYLIAKRRLDDRLAATILALALPLHPTIHGILQHDFHSLALLATPALWMLWCVEANRRIGYWIAFVVVLLIREDAALFAAGVGVYLILATPERRQGVLTIVLALAWLVFVKLVIMPDPALLMTDSPDNYTYANRYRRLIPEGGGALEGFATLLTNPGFVVEHVLTMEKLWSVMVQLLPLALLPLWSGRKLLLAVYGLAFIYLATHKGIYYPLNHYASTLYPALFFAAPDGIARAKAWLIERHAIPAERARAMVLGWTATCVILTSVSMGSLFGKTPFRPEREVHGFDERDRERYEWFVDAVSIIPPDASVTASNRTAPHLSNRAELYILQQRIESDWVVVHDEDTVGEDRTWARKLLRSGRYELVTSRQNEFRVMRRIVPSE